MYFSARSASWAPLLFQHTTRCHSVFSCFSPLWAVHWRPVASESVATREPLLVLRTSGSAPKFPISITLFRLRLTSDLQRKKRAGDQGAPQYMSRKSFCQPKIRDLYRIAACSNCDPQNHGVLDRQTIIARPPADASESELRVEVLRGGVRFAHFEIHAAHP